MTNPFLAMSKFVSTVTDASADLFAPVFKPTLTAVTGSAQGLSIYPLLEGDGGRRTARQGWFIYGHVRWSAQRIIIEWQTKQAVRKESFVIYRSRTMVWREASLIDLSIFTTANSQTNFITYRAVDVTIVPPGPYYYWIATLSGNYDEQRYGPYRSSMDDPSAS
jgi:hypothetical protein